MNDGNLTTEHLRAVERWENEGGKATAQLRITPTSQMEIKGMDQAALPELIFARKKRPWNVDAMH